MSLSEYVTWLETQDINESVVSEITMKYHCDLPKIIKKILSSNKETIFLSGERRILSYDEVLQAKDQLHVDFIAYGIIPLIDCYDNNFIVYDYKNNTWNMFNIVDECIFDTKKSLEDFH